jgi:hypothetical protein
MRAAGATTLNNGSAGREKALIGVAPTKGFRVRGSDSCVISSYMAKY